MADGTKGVVDALVERKSAKEAFPQVNTKKVPPKKPATLLAPQNVRRG